MSKMIGFFTTILKLILLTLSIERGTIGILYFLTNCAGTVVVSAFLIKEF